MDTRQASSVKIDGLTFVSIVNCAPCDFYTSSGSVLSPCASHSRVGKAFLCQAHMNYSQLRT